MCYYEHQIRRWTATAKECYLRGCICNAEVFGGIEGHMRPDFSPCPIYELYFKSKRQKCQMKHAVLELVRKFGIPKEFRD